MTSVIDIIKNKDDIENFFKVLEQRGAVDEGNYIQAVKQIVKDIKENKDLALKLYTQKLDDPNFTIETMEVTKEEQKAAYDSLDPNMQRVIKKAKDRITDYHMHLRRDTWTYRNKTGEVLGQKITPIENVGVYVPGGKASYPSSVLMNVIPAKVAGVKNVTMCTPAVKGYINPLTLACAYICEVDHIYKIGGAQAIAAMAYGTETIKPVNKIVGPGNIFVALAKKEVYGKVGIDSIAGPSEICIIADNSANPQWVAADLMAQAEHDEIASAVVFVTDEVKGKQIRKYVNFNFETALRQNILAVSLKNYSKIIVVKSIDEAIEYTNRIAPEHLELAFDDARDYIEKVKNAGAIFVGHYSAEAFGDYMAGPNHVLPTVGTAKFFSPLGVDDFIKKSSIIEFNKASVANLVDDVDTFAQAESLEMHAYSARLRGEK